MEAKIFMIIFFHGADGWRSREKVRELTASYSAKNPGGTGLFRFDFEEAIDPNILMRQLEETLSGGGLFAAKKFVVVKNVFGKEKKGAVEKGKVSTVEKKKVGKNKPGSPIESGMTNKGMTNDGVVSEGMESGSVSNRATDFLELLERHKGLAEKDSATIVLVWEVQALKKIHPLMKYLEQQSGMQQEFAPLDERHLEAWVVSYLKKNASGVTITREALRRLLAETSADLFRLESELLKLANFVGEGVIESEVVEQLVREDRLENRVFDAFNALAVGDTRTALSTLERYATSMEETLKILGLCAWQLRMIASISDAYYTQGARTENAVAQATGYKPFQVGKILRYIGKYTPEEMQRRFKLLAELDAQAKGQDGGLDARLALSLFVMKF